MKPFFSIIIPTLNEEKYLPKLLASLAGQTDRDFEVVVSDGNSVDKTVSKAEEFNNKLKSLNIVRCPHAGLPYQRNKGAKEASGSWLVFSDADNIFFPYAVERIKNHIKTNKSSFFTSWVSPDTNIRSEVLLTMFANIIIEGSVLMKRSFSPGPLTGIKRKIFEDLKGYDEKATWGEDMEFAQRAVKSGHQLDIIRETLYIWSMRRFRNEGKMKVLQKFARASLYALLTKRALTKMDGYEMGGHLYRNTNKIKPSIVKTIDHNLKKIFTEFFS